MKHLIITTAVIPKELCSLNLGYSYEKRMSDYKDSFEYVLKLKDKFNTITILETVSKEKVDELENSGINVYYSNIDNSFKNKGINEILHIQDFLKNSNINDDDIVIKLSGRYLIENDNILSINSDFIAKYDGDIYPGDRGVHTFFFGFKKKLFFQFVSMLNISSINTYEKICIEWLIKDFMISKNISILNNSYKLGVVTCLYSKEMNRWTKVST